MASYQGSHGRLGIMKRTTLTFSRFNRYLAPFFIFFLLEIPPFFAGGWDLDMRLKLRASFRSEGKGWKFCE